MLNNNEPAITNPQAIAAREMSTNTLRDRPGRGFNGRRFDNTLENGSILGANHDSRTSCRCLGLIGPADIVRRLASDLGLDL